MPEPTEEGPLASLVRTLYDLRLALVALAVVVEVVASGSAVTVTALVLALPLSYVPLRRWRGLQRRRDLLAVDALAAAVLTVLVTDPQVMLLYSVTTVALAGLIGDRLGALVVAGVLGSFLAGATAYTAMTHTVRPGSVATSLAFVALYALAAPGALRLTRLLEDYQRATRTAQTASHRAAQAEERSRLAREMHDSLSKTVQGTHLMALALQRRLGGEPVEPRLHEDMARLVNACDIATRDARRLLHDLRSATDSDLSNVGRRIEEVVLDWQTRTAAAARIEDRTGAAGAHLPCAVVYEIGCIVGEALDNAWRHGGADTVEVELSLADGWLHLRVRDHGRGFVPPSDLGELHRSGHYGLVGMRERSQRIGARLTVDGTPGEGTTVGLAVPAPSLVPAVEAPA